MAQRQGGHRQQLPHDGATDSLGTPATKLTYKPDGIEATTWLHLTCCSQYQRQLKYADGIIHLIIHASGQ
jgi:hypothetical protein